MRKSAPLFCALLLSLSARRAWIEIHQKGSGYHAKTVALRKESVDRNRPRHTEYNIVFPSLSARRAWIEISSGRSFSAPLVSLSARRAWIEITCPCPPMPAWRVALRKESVDRNIFSTSRPLYDLRSLSARRAWIEIAQCLLGMSESLRVALRKESVDRNTPAENPMISVDGRSPQGERG